MALFSKTLGLIGVQSARLVNRRWHSLLMTHSHSSVESSSCSCPSHHQTPDTIGVRFAQTQADHSADSSKQDSSSSSNTFTGPTSKLNRKDRRSADRDRRVPVAWETGVRYMDSETYRRTYGDYKVWQLYRRPLKTQMHQVPFTNRISCVKEGFITYATPCPICRDRNLVLHENNTKLLQQFVDPWTQEVYDMRKIHVCQVKYEELLVAMYKARDLGQITFSVPFRQFDYEEFYSKAWLENGESIDYRLADENPIYRKLQDIQDPTNKPYTVTDFP
jgi:small subunit ribosomal protein S18b